MNNTPIASRIAALRMARSEFSQELTLSATSRLAGS
jgi:hypothetical protein